MKTNVIYNKDCIEGIKDLSNNSIDIVVTDPPYLIDYKTGFRNNKEHKFCSTIQNDNNPDIIKNIMPEIYRVMKNNTALYMFCNSSQVDFFKQEIEKYFDIKNMIIWVKNNWTAGDLESSFGKQYEILFLANKGRRNIEGKRLSNIWSFDRISGDKQVHQNQKPVELIERCLNKHSKKNDIVLDPFIGSGTTAVAAIKYNRKYIGYELDKFYYQVAIDRISQTKASEKNKLTDFLK